MKTAAALLVILAAAIFTAFTPWTSERIECRALLCVLWGLSMVLASLLTIDSFRARTPVDVSENEKGKP